MWWPFKRKKVHANVEVVEPKTLSLDMIMNMELRNLSDQNLSIKTKCMAIHNTLRRYRELGYKIDVNH
jgi:hypothetical protein